MCLTQSHLPSGTFYIIEKIGAIRWMSLFCYQSYLHLYSLTLIHGRQFPFPIRFQSFLLCSGFSVVLWIPFSPTFLFSLPPATLVFTYVMNYSHWPTDTALDIHMPTARVHTCQGLRSYLLSVCLSVSLSGLFPFYLKVGIPLWTNSRFELCLLHSHLCGIWHMVSRTLFF